MVERYRPQGSLPPLVRPPLRQSLYFGDNKTKFIDTGCVLLNCVVSGAGDKGWPLGKVINIVGDRSTGKTLLAEEAMANFFVQYPRGKVYYRETEAAFDVTYAQALGVDTNKIDFGPDGPDTKWNVIEDIIDDIKKLLDEFDERVKVQAKKIRERNKRLPAKDATVEAMKSAQPTLYILDSLDALSSESELKRDVRQGSYNLEKQKLLGELFRKETRRLKQANVCLIFISQIRDRIGPMIRGKKYTRTGGKALDFYASVVLYLSELGKVYQTIKGIKRPVAVKIKAKCDKNKITMPFRECIFDLRFGYGIDDVCASVAWLEEVKRLKAAGFDKSPDVDKVDVAKLRRDVASIWYDVERGFIPVKGKYAA